MGKFIVILCLSVFVSGVLCQKSEEIRALKRKYGKNWRSGLAGYWDLNGIRRSDFLPPAYGPPLQFYPPPQPYNQLNGFQQPFPAYFPPPVPQSSPAVDPFKQQPLGAQAAVPRFGGAPFSGELTNSLQLPASNSFSKLPSPQPVQNPNEFATFRQNPIFSNGLGQFSGQQNPIPPVQVVTMPLLHPWWLGDNVCVDKDESVEDWDEDSDFKSGFQSGFAVNFESCLERFNKHICKTIYNKNGRKLTKTVTRQCCQGYGRSKKDGPNALCEKVELLSFQNLAEKYGSVEFINIFKNNNLTDQFSKNSTLFVPIKVTVELQNGDNKTTTTTTTTTTSSPRDVSIVFDHFIARYIQVEYVENEEVYQSKNNDTIRFNVFPRPPSNDIFEYPHQYTANCIPIIKPNLFAQDGIVLGIQREITPVKNNLMEIIRSRNDLSIFRSVLEASNLTDVLEKQDAITILAPNDKAFESLKPALGRALVQGNMCALDNLRNHILGLTFCSSAVVSNTKAHAFNVLGEPIVFDRNRKGRTINAEDWVIVNDKARFVESDIMGTNGVMHIIDNVLPTDTGMPITSLLEKKNSTIFPRLVEAAGLTEEFDTLGNVTYFIPTDRAFEESGWLKELENNPDSLANNDTLKHILRYHVAQHTIGSHQLHNGLIRTHADENLIVNVFNPNPLTSIPQATTTINCARFVTTDDVGCNVVLHQVDKVFEPPMKNFLEILESTEDYSKFFDIIKAANMTELLRNDNEDRTLLIPTNDVFAEQMDFYHSLVSNRHLSQAFVNMHLLKDSLCCAGIQNTGFPFLRSAQTLSGITLSLNRLRRPLINNVGVTKCDVITKNGIVHEINDVIDYKDPKTGAAFY